MEQWQLVGLITRRSLVRVQPPLPKTRHKITPPVNNRGLLLLGRWYNFPPHVFSKAVIDEDEAMFDGFAAWEWGEYFRTPEELLWR